MISWGKPDIIGVLENLKRLFNDSKDLLVELDGKMGDGDLGLTMAKAFSAAYDGLRDTEEADLGKILMKAGMSMAQNAPSTMGTLMATGFMRGGKALSGKERIILPDLADFFQAFANGIMERGKARPGEKTVVDVLKPAADRLSELKDSDFATAMRETLAAAESGLEATKDMIAQHGPNRLLQGTIQRHPRTRGATAGVILIKGFVPD